MGYYRNAERTGEAFVQNPLNDAYPEIIYRTGDIGKYNERGELLFVSRKDSQIKHMGHRIELGEIDAAACRHDDVSRSCCLYDADEKRIVLFYEGKVEKESLLAFLATYLPRYMMPSAMERMDALPLTDNGKIDRRTLRERMKTI
jgi:acyl-coenzyme A synthetase/AMP-(fatty) acid ligase